MSNNKRFINPPRHDNPTVIEQQIDRWNYEVYRQISGLLTHFETVSIDKFDAPSSGAPTLDAFNSGVVKRWAFDGAGASESLMFQIKIPYYFVNNTNIQVSVNWCASTLDAGNVRWGLSYYKLRAGSTPSAVGSTSIVAATTLSAYTLINSPMTDISITDLKQNDILICWINRDSGTGTDTYGHDAFLLSVDFKFITDFAR